MKCNSAGINSELNRLDIRTREPISELMCQQLEQAVRTTFESTDGLIVLDQVVEANWGVVNHRMKELLIALQRDQPGKLIFVDSRAHLGSFQVGILKGNRREVLMAAGLSADGSVGAAIEQLRQQTGQMAVCTCGEDGVLFAVSDGRVESVPAFDVEGPVDIVGAGDSFTSGMVAALLSDASEREAILFGNLVASITVQQIGTTGTASPGQIRRLLAS